MDSITQAVLGASMGQACLGKKLGNRALFWGALAGTIPDLDVFSRLFISHPLYGLVYHRGLTHSLLFTVLAPLLLAWLGMLYYKKGLDNSRNTQLVWAILSMLLYSLVLVGLGFWLINSLSFVVGFFFLLSLFGAYKLFVHFRRQVLEAGNFETQNPSYGSWYLMFFLATLTHWLIDACTAYGTQIFEPFSSYRIAFNNISIVDPLYTVPFLLFLGILMFQREHRWRRLSNNLALGLSSLYLLFSFYAKGQANAAVEKSLAAQGIEYQDYITYPSIGNTILWQSTIDAGDAYYYGYYSLFDSQEYMKLWRMEKNHELLDSYKDQELVDIVKWFAQGYYNVLSRGDGTLQVNNLRFGLIGEPKGEEVSPSTYIFKYMVGERDGQFDVWQERDLDSLNIGRDIGAFWIRLKGN